MRFQVSLEQWRSPTRQPIRSYFCCSTWNGRAVASVIKGCCWVLVWRALTRWTSAADRRRPPLLMDVHPLQALIGITQQNIWGHHARKVSGGSYVPSQNGSVDTGASIPRLFRAGAAWAQWKTVANQTSLVFITLFFTHSSPTDF